MPVDRGAIDAQLREIGEGERWWDQREFRDLPYILRDGERIRGLVVGKLLGPRRPRVRPAGQWLIVATQQRLVCLKQERFARKQVEIAGDEIVSVHQGSRLRAYQVTIQTPQRRYRIRIRKADAFRFARALAPFVPQASVAEIGAALGPAPWHPGAAALAALPGVSGIVEKLARPAADAARERHLGLEATVERLQEDVARLQQQVAFLENLLHEQADAGLRARTPAHPHA